VFSEREFQPIAELLLFRDATRFSHAHRVRALPQSARMYHSFGTTSVKTLRSVSEFLPGFEADQWFGVWRAQEHARRRRRQPATG
jgi:hypothetical protein